MFVNFSIIITLIAVELQLPAWDNFVLFFGFDLPNVSDNYTVPYDRPQPPLLPLNKPTVDLQRFNLMLSKVNYWKVGQLTLGVCALGLLFLLFIVMYNIQTLLS
jgi:hypothetical protein